MNKIARGLVASFVTAVLLFALPSTGIVSAEEVLPDEPQILEVQMPGMLEGRSLLPVLQGKDRSGHDYLFWEHEGNRAVRHGKMETPRPAP